MKTVQAYFNNNTKQQQAFRPRNYSIDYESDDDQMTINRQLNETTYQLQVFATELLNNKRPLYVIFLSRTRFRVNLYSIVA